MSNTKRSRQRQPEPPSASPASKRLKTTSASHAGTRDPLAFLVDDDARSGRKLEARLTNGVPNKRLSHAAEYETTVASNLPTAEDASNEEAPVEVIDISSAEEESSADEEEGDEQELSSSKPDHVSTVGLQNGHKSSAGEDVSMNDADELKESEGQTFGELLQAQHPDTIDIQASLHANSTGPRDLAQSSGKRALSVPSATSLGTVLTQALKTNDIDLLESCFQMNDRDSIRTTIERLPSQHVATLFQRIAERIHKRPGRAGNLLMWIQWSLVAHGGYLATHPQVMGKVKAMTRVIRDRASGLQPLLHLKGKLDLLSAQLDLRRQLHENSRRAQGDSDDEDDVLYVEGQEDEQDSDDDALVRSIEAPGASTSKRLETSDDESNDDAPNGLAFSADADEDVDDNSDDEEPGLLIDGEAEESSGEESDGEPDSEEGSSGADSVDEDDDDDEGLSDDDDDSDAGVKPVPLSLLHRKK